MDTVVVGYAGPHVLYCHNSDENGKMLIRSVFCLIGQQHSNNYHWCYILCHTWCVSKQKSKNKGGKIC